MQTLLNHFLVATTASCLDVHECRSWKAVLTLSHTISGSKPCRSPLAPNHVYSSSKTLIFVHSHPCLELSAQLRWQTCPRWMVLCEQVNELHKPSFERPDRRSCRSVVLLRNPNRELRPRSSRCCTAVLAGNFYCLACHIDLLPNPAGVTKFVDASAKCQLIADLVAIKDRIVV